MPEDEKKHEAQIMAEIIEKWFSNPVVKQFLKFCTKEDKCGKRMDIALKKYTGEKIKTCIRCDIAYFIVKSILDYFIKKGEFKKEDILTNLRDYMFRKGLASVLKGLATFGPKKPFTSYSPFLVVWNYTRACNLNCKHCYESAHTKAKDELTTRERLNVIKQMNEAGIAYVALSGGEPLVEKDFFQIAEALKENEIAFSLATNGTLLTKENCKKLEKVDCRYVQVSLDGAKARTHNWLRGANTFQRTIQGIKNAVDTGLCVGIASTITSKNYKEVRDLINLTEKLGADIWMHYNFVPTGRGKDIAKLDITPQQREEMLKMLAKETKKRKITLLSTAPQYGRVSVQCGLPGSLTHFDKFSQELGDTNIQFLAEFVGGCGAGRLYFALEPNGDIEPCVFIPIKLGNVRKDDLGAVWRNNPILKKIRDREHFSGFCRTCNFRNVCGGCRARAYGYFRDIQASDPGCIYNLKYWKQIRKK